MGTFLTSSELASLQLDSAFFGLFSAQKSGPSARTALIVFCGFGHKKCAKKICAPERTVDQNKADNPGSERAGVGHFWVGAELVSSSVTYHDGSRVGPTRPGPD